MPVASSDARCASLARVAPAPQSVSRWLAVALLVCSTALAEDASERWRSETFPDPMHKGGRIVLAEQRAQSTAGHGLQVQVRCWSATREFDVRFVLPDGSFATDEVRWRFDRGPVASQNWRRSVALDALVVPASSNPALIRSMRSARELTLWNGPSDQDPYRISLAGSSSAFADLNLICGK